MTAPAHTRPARFSDLPVGAIFCYPAGSAWYVKIDQQTDAHWQTGQRDSVFQPKRTQVYQWIDAPPEETAACPL